MISRVLIRRQKKHGFQRCCGERVKQTDDRQRDQRPSKSLNVYARVSVAYQQYHRLNMMRDNQSVGNTNCCERLRQQSSPTTETCVHHSSCTHESRTSFRLSAQSPGNSVEYPPQRQPASLLAVRRLKYTDKLQFSLYDRIKILRTDKTIHRFINFTRLYLFVSEQVRNYADCCIRTSAVVGRLDNTIFDNKQER